MRNILCFGDSNTWGYNPASGERFPEDVRWTGILQKQLGNDVKVIEEGLCGRTTVYEDLTRPGRKGVDSIPEVLEKEDKLDLIVLMLGTNDCKAAYNSDASSIAEGISECVDRILRYVEPEKVLLVSPILLGEKVWEPQFDPEFSDASVDVSRALKNEYAKVAHSKKIDFMAASDYAVPSVTDQEHMDVKGHRLFAQAIYNKINRIKEAV